MTDVAKLLSADVARRLLEKRSPLTSLEICRHVLALENLSPGLAEKLAEAFLSDDPRFCRLPEGAWVLTEALEKTVPLERALFVVVDVETTGFSPPADRIIELGCVRVADGRVMDEFSTLVNPRRPVPGMITGLTGITYAMVADAPTFGQVAESFLDFLDDAVFVAHNAPFDWRFIQNEIALATGRKLLNRRLCTRCMAKKLCPELSHRKLDDLACFFNLDFGNKRHRALGDALVTAKALLKLIERAREKGIESLQALSEYLKPHKSSKK